MIKGSMCILVMEQHLIVQVCGVLIMTLLEKFDVDDSSSSHADHRKNNFLALGEGPTFGINGR